MACLSFDSMPGKISYDCTMHLDVTDLSAFYDSGLGTVVRRILRRRIRSLWPDVRGLRVLGLGYATPYLGPFTDEAERVIALMPGAQGVKAWPRKKRNLTALCEDHDLALADCSMDRILIVHGLETGASMRPLLREVWRVLAPGGRVMIVAPNRRGLWALSDRTPFGAGSPFTRHQLMKLLTDQMFTPTQWDAALHIWPIKRAYALRWAMSIERLGAQWLPGLAGVHLVEASKQIYGMTPVGALQRPRRVPATVKASAAVQPFRTRQPEAPND
jgi:SAM-dependent methyltransferase